jgi:hypothetical protein
LICKALMAAERALGEVIFPIDSRSTRSASRSFGSRSSVALTFVAAAVRSARHWAFAAGVGTARAGAACAGERTAARSAVVTAHRIRRVIRHFARITDLYPVNRQPLCTARDARRGASPTSACPRQRLVRRTSMRATTWPATFCVGRHGAGG